MSAAQNLPIQIDRSHLQPVPTPPEPDREANTSSDRRARRRRRSARRQASPRRLTGIGLALGLTLCFAAPALAARVSGVEFQEQIAVEDTSLRLQGAGLLRYKIVFKGYAAALYLDDEATLTGADFDGASITALPDATRRLEIEYFWSIPASAFADATREGIARHVDDSRYAMLADRIEQLASLYRDVSPGDRYSITSVPGRGTELSLNGETLGWIPGADFADAVFGIWLGPDPIDAGLKDHLLGAERRTPTDS